MFTQFATSRAHTRIVYKPAATLHRAQREREDHGKKANSDHPVRTAEAVCAANTTDGQDRGALFRVRVRMRQILPRKKERFLDFPRSPPRYIAKKERAAHNKAPTCPRRLKKQNGRHGRSLARFDDPT